LTEAQPAHIQRRLIVCPTIRGSDLWLEKGADYGYTGRCPAFTSHLRTLRPTAQCEPEVRFETDPGVQARMDWAYVGRLPLDDGLVKLFGILAVLGDGDQDQGQELPNACLP
jgi:hypothetical protein